MRVGVVGLGLIGGSIALGLRDRHEVVGYDSDPDTRRAARTAGLRIAEHLKEVLPADAVVVATPLAAIVPTLDALLPRADGAVLVEVGSLKAAVAAYAERAPAGVRIVGLHPMAGTTASGFGSADPALLRDRPFLVVSTARSDEKAIYLAGELARDLGGVVTRCDPAVHDRAMAVVSALPLAVAVALERVARDAVPLPLEAVAGTGFRDATRLAGTSSELALALLAAPGLAGHIAALRSALAEVERSLGSEPALRDLLGKVHR